MVELATRPRVGPYILTRRLRPGYLGQRWLALDERDTTSHVVHRLRPLAHGHDPLQLLHAVQQCAALDHPHVLKIEAAALDTRGRPFAVTPYTGDSDGVLTLEELLRRKGGYMPLEEARRAIEQVLGAVGHAHEQGLVHGPLALSEVQVDRRGSLTIELYGVGRLLRGVGAAAFSRAGDERREVRSAIEVLYQLITGLRAEEPVIPAGRVIDALDHSWDDLFETGLSEPGFSSAAHALSAVRGCRLSADPGRGLLRVTTAIRKLLFTAS